MVVVEWLKMLIGTNVILSEIYSCVGTHLGDTQQKRRPCSISKGERFSLHYHRSHFFSHSYLARYNSEFRTFSPHFFSNYFLFSSFLFLGLELEVTIYYSSSCDRHLPARRRLFILPASMSYFRDICNWSKTWIWCFHFVFLPTRIEPGINGHEAFYFFTSPPFEQADCLNYWYDYQHSTENTDKSHWTIWLTKYAQFPPPK